jgi:hypothetical protein
LLDVSEKKLIAAGATGSQSGGLARAILDDPSHESPYGR